MKPLNKIGFTLVELMIVIGIIGFLSAVAIPSFIRSRATAQAASCIANLKQMEGATQLWAVDTSVADTAVPLWDDLIPNYIRTRPKCPGGGDYVLASSNSRPTCSLGNSTTPAHVLP